MRMMMIRTVRILECQGVEGAALAMAMAMTTARVRTTRRAVRKEPGTERVQRMGKGNGRGRETVKGKVVLNKPQEEMISLVPCFAVAKGNV
jgi:hypothetical protein